jgi:hypothetical protein
MLDSSSAFSHSLDPWRTFSVSGYNCLEDA